MAERLLVVLCTLVLPLYSTGARDNAVIMDDLANQTQSPGCTTNPDFNDNGGWVTSRGGRRCYADPSAKKDEDAVEIWLYRVAKQEKALLSLPTSGCGGLPDGNFANRAAASHLPGGVWVGGWKVKLWADSMSEYFYGYYDERQEKTRLEYRLTYHPAPEGLSCAALPEGMAKVGIRIGTRPGQWSQCGKGETNHDACYKDACMKRDEDEKPRWGPLGVFKGKHPGAMKQLQTCAGETACWFAVPDDQKNLLVLDHIEPRFFQAGGDSEEFFESLHAKSAEPEGTAD